MAMLKKIFEDIDLDLHLPDEKKPAGTEKYKSMMFKMVIGMMPGLIKGGGFGGHEAVISEYNVIAERVIKKKRSC